MVATNDDLLAEMQKQTTQLKAIKKLLKGQYMQDMADEIINQPDV
jgi:hypothetical protein